MLLVLVFVFLAVFTVSAMVLVAGRSSASKESEQTLATLQAAIATSAVSARDPSVDIRKDELLSAVPLINRWLLTMEFAPRTRLLLSQAELNWTTGTLLLLCGIFFLIPAYLLYLQTGNLGFALLIGFFLAACPIGYVFWKRSRRFAKFETELPQTLDLMVSAMRAGHSFVSALDIAAAESPDPVGKELRICFDEQNYGLDMKTAMANLVTRVPLQDLRLVVTAVLIQRESGGNLAEIFDKAAYVIRERFRLRREVNTRTAQGRMTGWILSLLPAILGVALYATNPKYISMLWHEAIGVKFLYAAAIMTITGGLIIRKIVRMDV